MISDEDWHEAHEIVCTVRDASVRYPDDADSGDIVNALVKAGWGPKPTVSPTKLGEFIDAANAGGMAVPWRDLQDYLRECGIEVTE